MSKNIEISLSQIDKKFNYKVEIMFDEETEPIILECLHEEWNSIVSEDGDYLGGILIVWYFDIHFVFINHYSPSVYCVCVDKIVWTWWTHLHYRLSYRTLSCVTVSYFLGYLGHRRLCLVQRCCFSSYFWCYINYFWLSVNNLCSWPKINCLLLPHYVVLLLIDLILSSNRNKLSSVVVVIGGLEPVRIINTNSSEYLKIYAGCTKYYRFYLRRSWSIIFLCHLDTFLLG